MRDVERMVSDIELQVRETSHWIGRQALAPRVYQALREVPRHQFIAPQLRGLAYADGPVSIGHGQTVSQPYIVALMTDLLNTAADHTVLEVGTGSGYQAAVLSHLVKQVYSIEIIEALAREAQQRLADLQISNVEIRTGDGYSGWPEHAPYDGIIVTAAAPHIPPALIEQLKCGGCLVIPVGQPYMRQDLTVVEKDAQGKVETRMVLPVAFVPLTGGHGEQGGDE